jgi:protease IV
MLITGGQMKMKRCIVLSLFVLLFVVPLLSQSSIPPFHSQHDFLLSSPGAFKFGLYGYDNPALLSYLRQPDIFFTWTDMDGSFGDLNRWGLFAAAPNLGFGMIRQETPLGSVTDYRLSSAFGNRSFSAGMSYGWSGGDKDLFNREKSLSLGTLARPNKYLSIGVVGYTALKGKSRQVYADLAVRPLGNERLTVFGDFAMQNKQSVREGTFSWGAVVEALPGVRVSGRVIPIDNKAFNFDHVTIGLEFSLGRVGLQSQMRMDDNKRTYSTYGIRVGAYDRNVFDSFTRRRTDYLRMNFNGPVSYQRFRLFDQSGTLINILESIDLAADDPTVAGIAINLSDMRASHEMKWEIRDRLNAFRSTGKNVVVYIDRGGITDYHLASVADMIVMDPQGTITLEGFISGRTFLKGMFDKIGIGIDEWRFFEYKSAFEQFSREEMSEPDREQRQRLIDHFYELVRSDVTASRGIGSDEFDRFVNEFGIFSPGDAMEHGLIDSIGRWEELKNTIETIEGGKKNFTGPSQLIARQLPYDNRWSEPPRIAVIYALGVCAMDEGIKARSLVKEVERAARDGNVKAIVFRVDSPGGDPLASDIVAEALRKAMEKKPVVVSQGAVAASGGYWLSMYSNAIVAAPNTITGSIGVIGGWLYDNGLSERLGLSTDYVKVGTFADLGFGPTMPLFNLSLPQRNLTETEYAIMERMITTMYDEFVQKVADGRGMTFDEVEPHSQGRVWSGYDGLELGLVDELGSLADAIRIAKQKAGIDPGREVTVVEFPEPGLFDASMFMPRLFGVRVAKNDPFVDHLMFRLRHNGKPLPVLPLDYIHEAFIDYK